MRPSKPMDSEGPYHVRKRVVILALAIVQKGSEYTQIQSFLYTIPPGGWGGGGVWWS